MKDTKKENMEIASAIKGINTSDILFAIVKNKNENYEGFSFIESKDDMIAVAEFITRCMLESETFAKTFMICLETLLDTDVKNDDTEFTDAQSILKYLNKSGSMPIIVNKKFES